MMPASSDVPDAKKLTAATVDAPAWYSELVSRGKLKFDPKQEEAAGLLNSFIAARSEHYSRKGSGLWKKLVRNSGRQTGTGARGIYLHGGVGRGKTFLMDEFFLNTPVPEKRRVHFHAFMRHFHSGMNRLASQNNGKENNHLAVLTKELARQFKLICFDEFHVSDIGDAMILARILSELLRGGTDLIMTSNYAPRDLYRDGLARHLFLPTIELIEKSFIVFDMGDGADYRREKLAGDERFFYPLADLSRQKLSDVYEKFACGSRLPPVLEAGGRKIPAIARCSDSIWFCFSELCRAARGKEDYLRLAEKFNVVFISEIPSLHDPALAEASRRFTWLVDILYDEGCIPVMSAAVSLADLYGKGKERREGGESGRTLSRLFEMHSADYLESGFRQRSVNKNKDPDKDPAKNKESERKNGGADGTRTRDLRRDRPAF